MKWDDSLVRAFDFETSGTLPEYALQPWRVAQQKAWPTSLAIVQLPNGTPQYSGGLNPDRDMMAAFLEGAIRDKTYIAGWNVVFDIAWLLAYDLRELVFKAKWLDGMLLWRHYFLEPEYDADRPDLRKSYKLEAAIDEYLPQLSGYKGTIDFHDPDPRVRAELHKYNKKDAIATWILTKHFYHLLNPQQLVAAKIEADSLPMIAEANLEGMLIDQIAVRELEQNQLDLAAEMLAKVAPHGATEKIVRSPTQLAKLMFDDWGLPVLKENTGKKTGKVSRSTDKDVLHELAIIDERAKNIRSYRGALNNRTKFAENCLNAAAYNENGRAHPTANPFGTYTSRLTYSSQQGKGASARQTGFPLHQNKRGRLFRSHIIAPPGYMLVEFDAAGQEFRWMAIASGDETMMQLCLPGEDPHSYMGSRAAGIDYRKLIEDVHAEDPVAKNFRQMGKVGNLSLQFRTSARTLLRRARTDYDMDMVLSEAELLWRTYRNTYPRVPAYWDRQIQLTRQRGYVETFAGRRVQVVGDWDGRLGWAMESTSINYRIQGTGGDQKYLAMAMLRPYMTRHALRFAWDMHDGLYMYVPIPKIERVTVEARQILNNLPYTKAWGFTPPIPMPWDCKVGHSWGTLKEVKDGH